MTSTDIITENSETFTIGKYNGISILIRNKDNYVNAGKMCRDTGKDFYGLKRYNKWNEILKYWQKEETVNSLPPIYELRKGYNKCKGIYVHKDLIHFVAEFVSIEHTFKVKRIMDSINENNNENLNKEFNDLKSKVEIKDDIIFENSVGTKDNNRILKIIYINEDYIVSARQNSNSGGQLIKEFIFPSAMSIRQNIRAHFNKDDQAPRFTKNELPKLYEYIKSLEPK
jgi:hypothetical protein